MPQGKRPKRSEQREETKRRLLEVSLRLFVHQGYAGTTVRDIAEKAGVSVGLMFHYFPSKQAILEEHARTVGDAVSSVARLLAKRSQPVETFTTIAKMILESLQDEYAKNLFLLANQILSLESIPKSAKRLVSSSRSIEASIPLIKLGQRRHEIKPGNPLALAIAFWGALQGIAEVLVWYPSSSIPNHEDVVDVLRA